MKRLMNIEITLQFYCTCNILVKRLYSFITYAVEDSYKQTLPFIFSTIVLSENGLRPLMTFLQDSFEKLLVYAYVWCNEKDPDLYGDWDFEVET